MAESGARNLSGHLPIIRAPQPRGPARAARLKHARAAASTRAKLGFEALPVVSRRPAMIRAPGRAALTQRKAALGALRNTVPNRWEATYFMIPKSRAEHASTRAGNLIREGPNQWHRNMGLDTQLDGHDPCLDIMQRETFDVS